MAFVKRPPKHIRRMSPKRRAREIEYHKRRRWFLTNNTWCEWGLRQNPPQRIRATQVHHFRGRLGRLLLDERFWLAVSEKGHDWIHNNIEAARKLGLICEKGLWNTQPD